MTPGVGIIKERLREIYKNPIYCVSRLFSLFGTFWRFVPYFPSAALTVMSGQENYPVSAGQGGYSQEEINRIQHGVPQSSIRILLAYASLKYRMLMKQYS